MPPDTTDLVPVQTHSCQTTQELAYQIRRYQIILQEVLDSGANSITVILASVNEASGVLTTDADFEFDGATAVIGTAPAGGTGTCDNLVEEAFDDDDLVLMLQTGTDEWCVLHRFTSSEGGGGGTDINLILASVNEASHVLSTDTDFEFDGATAIMGTAPAGGTGTCDNLLGESFFDNEQLIMLETDTDEWCVVSRKEINVLYGLTASSVSSGDATFNIDGIIALRGAIPSDPLTVSNVLQSDIANNFPVIALQVRDGTYIGFTNVDTVGGGGSGPADLIGFTLTAQLTLAGTSVAADIDWSTAGSSGNITVYDPEAEFTGEIDYTGIAVWDEDNSQYKIIRMIGPSRFGDFIATADSDVTTSTVTASLENDWGRPHTGETPGTTTGISVNKQRIDSSATEYCPVKSGQRFRGVWNERDSQWEMWFKPGWPGLDTALHQLLVNDEDGWPQYIETVEIDIITEITSLAITGGNLVLTYKKGTYKVAKEVTAESTETVTVPVTGACP